MPSHHDRDGFASRIRRVRLAVYGEGGAHAIAADLAIPPRTWENYEAGVTMPAAVALRLICLTGIRAEWLLTGEGMPFSPDERFARPRDLA